MPLFVSPVKPARGRDGALKVAQKQTYTYQGISEGGINWEIEIDIYTLLYIKQITNKDLLYSTGNSTQYSVMAYEEKNL